MKKMSVSAKTALGAMITALSVVILIPSAVQVFVYTLPAMAGMLTMLAVVEIDKKKFSEMSDISSSQGVVANVSPVDYVSVGLLCCLFRLLSRCKGSA